MTALVSKPSRRSERGSAKSLPKVNFARHQLTTTKPLLRRLEDIAIPRTKDIRQEFQDLYRKVNKETHTKQQPSRLQSCLLEVEAASS